MFHIGVSFQQITPKKLRSSEDGETVIDCEKSEHIWSRKEQGYMAAQLVRKSTQRHGQI
jgi:hypothetical protein